MNCEFCLKDDKVEIELINIYELMGESSYPSTSEYDADGKLMRVCPRCFTCDSFNLRGARELLKNILENQPGYSRRDKKAVAVIICNSRHLTRKERSMQMSTIINEVKWLTDKEAEKKLSEFFDIKLSKIQTLFYNIKIYRMIQNNAHHKRKKQQQRNWRVIPAEV